MTLFKIIDRKTGKEPTDRVITAQARLGHLIPCDIDGFYIDEDGQIILVDDCGNCTWLNMSRFKVEMQNEASPIDADVLDRIKADLWMEGVNMTDEYQGVWVRYRDIECIIDKYKASPTEEKVRKSNGKKKM